MPETHICISNTSTYLKCFLEMSSDWSCKVNNKGKLRSACVFTHPRRADYNKVTPQNLHRAKRARTSNGLDSATQTGNVPLLMEQTDTEPKWLCLIVSSNCYWFADGRCSVQSHPQLSLCQALCVRGERVLFPRSGLSWGHTLMSCWRSPMQVAVATYSVVTGQGQRVLAGLAGMPLWQKHQLVFEDHLENGEGQGSLLCHAFWASGGHWLSE